MQDVVQFALLFVAGATLGGAVNLAICRLAYAQTTISPWSKLDGQAPPRGWRDRLPIVGWLFLRRETAIHGRSFWLRPMLIELTMAIGLVWLYAWEIGDQGLYVAQLLAHHVPPGVAAGVVLPTDWMGWQFGSHVLLIALMAAASFIDIDEKIIPDEVTVPGTVLGLLLAAAVPWSLLPHIGEITGPMADGLGHELRQAGGGPILLQNGNAIGVGALTLVSTLAWPRALAGAPASTGLCIGLACYWLWCFAIMPRRRRVWYRRRGLQGACRLWLAQIRYSLQAWHVSFLLTAGTLGVSAVWWLGGACWAGLLTALVGLAGGGVIVWLVRVIGSAVLNKEAMGFGDVTLMMMIGTFIGWQASLIVFFLAPFAGLLVGLVQLIIRRDQEIPYGPFLCLATLLVVVRWADVWAWGNRMFEVPWLVPAALAICLVALAVLLAAWRLLQVMLGLGRR